MKRDYRKKGLATLAVSTLGLAFTVAGCGVNHTVVTKANLGSTNTGSVKTAVQSTVAKSVTVGMGNMAFQPSVIHVSTGTKVTWRNSDTVSHTVTSGPNRTPDGRFNSQDLAPGRSFSYIFNKPGTYAYYCVYHPGMNGTVVVQNGPTNTTTLSTMNMNGAPSPSTKSTDKIAPLGSGTKGELVGKDDIRLVPYRLENGVKVFHLAVHPVWWEVKPGQKVEAWAFNGSVPGPEIKVDSGDKVKILVTNDLPEGTSVHWHGLDVPFKQDGVGGLSQPDIKPGQTWTYQFTVSAPPGTYMYHSHPMMDMAKQETMGMYGPFVVEPKGTKWTQVHPGYQDEYTIVLNDSSQFGYTLNGKSFPATPVLPAKVGDKILVHLINVGDMNHPMHLHGFHFHVINQDGYPVPQPMSLDTIDTAPGTTYDLSFIANQPGEWLFHCHVLPHVTSGKQMTGMITLFDVK